MLQLNQQSLEMIQMISYQNKQLRINYRKML